MEAHFRARESFAPRVLSFVTRSEVMTMAWEYRRSNLRDRARLQWSVEAGRGREAQRELDAWRPMSMSEALKSAWQAVRFTAQSRAMEQATGPAVDRLRELQTQIEQLDGRTRWQSSHYDEMAGLRTQHAAAFEAVRAISMQGGIQLPV